MYLLYNTLYSIVYILIIFCECLVPSEIIVNRDSKNNVEYFLLFVYSFCFFFRSNQAACTSVSDFISLTIQYIDKHFIFYDWTIKTEIFISNKVRKKIGPPIDTMQLPKRHPLITLVADWLKSNSSIVLFLFIKSLLLACSAVVSVIFSFRTATNYNNVKQVNLILKILLRPQWRI